MKYIKGLGNRSLRSVNGSKKGEKTHFNAVKKITKSLSDLVIHSELKDGAKMYTKGYHFSQKWCIKG